MPISVSMDSKKDLQILLSSYERIRTIFVVAQIYVDYIVFGATNVSLAKSFADEMKKMIEMSMVG